MIYINCFILLLRLCFPCGVTDCERVLFFQVANARLKEAEKVKEDLHSLVKKVEQELEVSFRPSWFVSTRQVFIG